MLSRRALRGRSIEKHGGAEIKAIAQRMNMVFGQLASPAQHHGHHALATDFIFEIIGFRLVLIHQGA